MEKEINLNSEKENNINNLDDDTTFNRLKELQKLLKKESAIKELFIRMKDETKKSMESQCNDVLKKKIEVLDILQKINNENPINKKKSTMDSTKLPGYLKKYILVDNNYEYLSDLNRYVSNILKYLWEEPKMVADLLLRADKKDVKNFLAPWICNNFYQNILSPNYIEDPLIYIIYLLLKQEIDSIKKIEESDCFLDNTPCSYLLGQLIEHNDVKEFFKIILENTLEDLGTNNFMFSLDDLNLWQKQYKKTVSKSVFDKNFLSSQNVDKTGRRRSVQQRSKNNDNNDDLTQVKTLTKVDIKGITQDEKENIKNNINYQVFSSRYLTSIPLSELEENINDDKNDIWIKSYYQYLLLNAKGEKEIYSQNNFIDKMTKMNDPESVLVFYQEHFLKVMEFINKLFENLKTNYRIIPYALKVVCKIIYQLVINKFPNSNIIERSLFISKFFFKTLLFPILQKPDINALINDYIISNNTLSNLNIISDILWVLSTFDLFKDKEENNFIKGNLTPFNRFFLEKIPEIFEIYKSLIDVNLPKFIDGLIDKTIKEEDYVFDFFNENPNEISFYQNILFNIQEFNALYMNLVKYKNKLFPEQKEKPPDNIPTPKNERELKYLELKKRSESNKKKIKLGIEKIKSPDNFSLLTKLVNQVEYDIKKTEIKSEGFFSKKKVIEEKKEIVRYFHISQLLFNEKSNQIFSLEQKKFYFHIKEIKEKDRKTKELITKNNIIKCKNFLSSILYNYRILDKNDFNKGTTNNTTSILNELTHFMKSSNYLIDGTIPSEWYIKSLMEYLKKLPDEYKENDYEKLYKELTDELNESIKTCNFEYMSLFLDEMKFGNRNKLFFEKVKGIYIDIELNNKANAIIEKDIIDITLYFKHNEKKQEFLIYQEGIKEKQLEFLDSFTFDTKNKGNLCKTIEKFTTKFPNLNKFRDSDEIDDKISIFEFQKNLDIPNQMNSFFNIITNHLKSKIQNENELNIINSKIYDYVMSRIYYKIYPKGRNIQDVNILQKTCQLNWLEPENVIKGESQYDFDLVLPDIDNYFRLIRIEKSPRKKIINLNNIFLVINRLLKFTKGDVPIGVDDQMPLLTYCFIKAKPWKIFTDSHFMKLYIGNKKNKAEDNELSQLLTICDIIRQAKSSSFNNVNEKEYHAKSEVAYVELSEYLEQFLDT